MDNYVHGKKILALLFVFLLVVVWFKSSPYTALKKMFGYTASAFLHNEAGAESSLAMQEIELEYIDSLQLKNDLIDINGALAKMMNVQGYYSDMGMYIANGRYIVSMTEQTSTDYEYDEIMSFKNYLDGQGIQLLYVNAPTKYTNDKLFSEEFGVESYSNRNADLLLQRIADSGVNTIDLRRELEDEGMDIMDMFYRTDHHWTTRTGLWAARKIAEGLNHYCGYAIDTSIYDEENYSFKVWNDCWLGEQGRKLALSYVGLDDYVEIKPDFQTSFLFKYGEEYYPGTFDDFIDESFYDTETDVYDAGSWHYSYFWRNVINQDIECGKILFLGDSYAHVVEPFLALGVNEIHVLALREFYGNLRDYIEAGDYDTIIICYAQFMIGAHDDPTSANYNMFTFE